MIDLDDFTRTVHRDIPLSQHMGFRFWQFGADHNGNISLRTELPLAPNLNDKNTAFGGSIATLATLSGWSLVSLLGHCHNMPCQVVVYHSEQHFTAPIHTDLYSLAYVSKTQAADFIDQLKQQGRAKLALGVDIYRQDQSQNDTPSARFWGKYLAERP